MIKKLMVCWVLMAMLSFSASALVRYEGAPGVPYLIYGHVEWNEQLLSNARLEITNVNTGYIQNLITNSNGYWQQEPSNWLTTSAGRPPVMFGDVIKVKVTDGCGTGDICEKTFEAFTGSYKDWAVVDLSITGTLSCPSISCPSCSGGGGSSGGGCGTYCTESLCEDQYPCATTSCPEPVVCPESTDNVICVDDLIKCPSVEDKECIVPEEGDLLYLFLTTLFGAIVGGTGAYYFKKREAVVKNVGIKTYVSSKGTIKILHRHPGIKGYHNPDTLHRVTYEKHPKGEIAPLYEKDENGIYVYKN